MHAPLDSKTEMIATRVLDGAFLVHRSLDPGLLESVYETCLCHELSKMGVAFERQLSLPITYDGIQINAGPRLDLLVSDLVIVELKAVEEVLPIHEAQLLTYLKLTQVRLGLLLNFNRELLKNGIKRIVL